MTDRTELRRLLGEAPPLPYRDSPRTHGDPSNGPTYVALEAQLEGRWEEVATGSYDRWSGMGYRSCRRRRQRTPVVAG